MSVLLSVTAAQSLTQAMFDFVFSLPSAAETEPSLGPACLANESAGMKGEGKLLHNRAAQQTLQVARSLGIVKA